MYDVIKKSEIPVVSLQQVKAHLRLDHAEDDDYLLHLITVATEWVEEKAHQAKEAVENVVEKADDKVEDVANDEAAEKPAE